MYIHQLSGLNDCLYGKCHCVQTIIIEVVINMYDKRYDIFFKDEDIFFNFYHLLTFIFSMYDIYS